MGHSVGKGLGLFDPIKLGQREIKNRIVMAPVSSGFCTHDGHTTDQLIAFYVARAKGGCGLIVVQHTLVTDKYATSAGFLGLWNDIQIRGTNQLVEAIHSFGTKVVVQLGLGLGRQTTSRSDGKEVVAPSALPYSIPEENRLQGLNLPAVGQTPRELTILEISELEGAFVEGAIRAKKAGFDGIEIHGAHGYLIAQFVSPLSNQRNDLYGGSFANRLRLPLNLIEMTRKALGGDFIMGYRISGDEHVDGGLSLDESARIASEISNTGLDYLHLSSGRREAMNWVYPSGEGMMLREAEGIKKAVNIPVICPNFYTKAVAVKAINEGKTDLISMGRQLLADPDWPNKIREGRDSGVKDCARCGECFRRLYAGWKIACPTNPTLGSENFMKEYWPPYKTRRNGL